LTNSPEMLITALIFIIGLCFGSFLNVIVYRLPQNLSITSPCSCCPQCGKKLGVLELIPVLGYLVLRGRCRDCKAGIAIRYPLVELLTGVLFGITYIFYGLSLEFFIYATLLFLLFAIAQIDFKHRIVPNVLVGAGLITGLMFYLPHLISFFLPVPEALISERALIDALGGMILGGGIMLVIFLVSRGGMGAGDLKLMALIGLYVGLRGTAAVLLLGFLFGAVTGIVFMATGKLTRKDALPFAPFLSLGALIQVLWGDQIWDWYTSLL